MSSSPVEVPARLCRNGRAPDPLFLPDERLFLRWRNLPQVVFVANGKLTNAALPSPNFCVNREKFCEAPEDVLLPDYPNYGIASFRVGDIPQSVPEEHRDRNKDDSKVTFAPEHLPEEEMYPHTEVRSYQNGMFGEGVKPSKTALKYFREELIRVAVILREPGGNGAA